MSERFWPWWARAQRSLVTLFHSMLLGSLQDRSCRDLGLCLIFNTHMWSILVLPTLLQDVTSKGQDEMGQMRCLVKSEDL